MSVYSVGDSIAVGTGAAVADKTFARGGIPVGDEMHDYFRQAAAQAHAGDTVIVSGGYNGGDVSQMADWIKPLTAKGVHVAIIGLREEGLNPTHGEKAPYAHLAGKTPALNNKLRDVAHASGAVFAEETIAIANTIPGHEIHGNFQQLGKAALHAATGEAAPDKAVAKQVAPATLPEAGNKPSHEQLPAMSRAQVKQIQEALNAINAETHSNRYDLGKFGVKHDGVDGVKGAFTSGAIEAYEQNHHMKADASASDIIADMQKTARLQSEPAELPTAAPRVAQAQRNSGKEHGK